MKATSADPTVCKKKRCREAGVMTKKYAVDARTKEYDTDVGVSKNNDGWKCHADQEEGDTAYTQHLDTHGIARYIGE